METKLFEIRDTATFIPVMAVRFDPRSEEERYLLAHAGYGLTPAAQAEYVLLWRIAGEVHQATCDPYQWPGGPTVRTMPQAHEYIIEHWDDLKSGDVVDVEFILGETSERKVSERLEYDHL